MKWQSAGMQIWSAPKISGAEEPIVDPLPMKSVKTVIVGREIDNK